MNGRIMPTGEALVSAMEPIYLGIFEGIKAYVEGDVLSDGKLNIFGWRQHVDRLFRSAQVDGLAMPYSKAELLEAVR
jgi:branched-subunit amino acid aminotransferase/4-amino-4-deoxychorismate lyase